MAVLRFAAFELDTGSGDLRRSGRRVHLAEQPTRLLALLASRAGEVVERGRIRRELWGEGTHVDFEQSINTCVRQVRAALGDRAGTPRFVETVPRRGYRFVAPVETVAPRLSTGPAGARRRGRRRRWIWALSAAVVASAVAVAGLASRHRGAADRPVLAVLPFENLGAASADAYLADGLTEELIARLARRHARELAVVARTSSMHYRDSDRDTLDIGRDLGADWLLEGSVRRDGDRIRITAQLIDARDGLHRWASNYDRTLDGILEVQSEVSARIAEALALTVAPEAARAPEGPADPEAYRLYLRARHLLGERDPAGWIRARDLLERAIRIDPAHAPSHVAWAVAHRRNGATAAETSAGAHAALRRAQALDGESAEAWFQEAILRLYGDYDVDGAAAAFDRALALQPDYAEALHHRAAIRALDGDHAAALSSVRRALRLDPRSPAVRSDVGWYLYFARRYEEAIGESRATLERFPGHFWSRQCELLSAVLAGDLAAAAGRIRAEAGSSRLPIDGALARALDGEDDRAVVEAYWRQVDGWFRDGPLRDARDRSGHAIALVALGRHEAAIAALDRTLRDHASWRMPFLSIDPWFDPLRDDPGFRRLLERVRREGRRFSGRA